MQLAEIDRRVTARDAVVAVETRVLALEVVPDPVRVGRGVGREAVRATVWPDYGLVRGFVLAAAMRWWYEVGRA